MIRISRFLEYRIVIPGKGVSFRSPKAKKYKQKVKEAASIVFKKPLIEGMVDVLIDYFHQSQRRMDMDNLSKCIIDGLNSVLYVDDKQVRYQTSIAHNLQKEVRISGGPADLVKPLADYDEYVFIRIRSIG